MTVLATEAAPAVESAAARGSVSRQAARQRQHAQAVRARQAGASSPIDEPARARQRPARPAPAVTTRDRSTDRRRRIAEGKSRRKGESFTPGELASETRRRAPTTSYEGKNYQPAILAEFVAAVILVSATPFATSKNPEGLSPYAGSDIVKLLALTLTYFLLALISSSGRSAGRYAALFGLLILLAVGLNEAANVVTAFDLLAGLPLPGGGESTNPPSKSGGGSGGRSVAQ